MVVISTHGQNVIFGDDNVSLNGNQDNFKINIDFKSVLLESQKSNYLNILLFIANFYLLSIHVSFVKLQPLTLSLYLLQINLDIQRFKWRRHNAANNYV